MLKSFCNYFVASLCTIGGLSSRRVSFEGLFFLYALTFFHSQ